MVMGRQACLISPMLMQPVPQVSHVMLLTVRNGTFESRCFKFMVKQGGKWQQTVSVYQDNMQLVRIHAEGSGRRYPAPCESSSSSNNSHIEIGNFLGQSSP